MKTETVKIGDYVVQLILDEDSHLSVYVNSQNDSKVSDVNEDIANSDLEFGVRLTTNHIEKKHKE